MARALERAAAPDPGVLAAQYEAAGAIEDAVRWYLPAADAAQRRYDHAGAVQALERALALCARLAASRERDARELALLTALPAPLNALDGYRSERLDRVHERALELAGDSASNPSPRWCAPARSPRSPPATSTPPAPPAAQLRARGDDVLVVEGEWILGIAAYWSGRLEHARRHLEAALARWRPEHRGRAPAPLRAGHRAHVPHPARAHAVAAGRPRRGRSAPATPRSPTPASTSTRARSCTCGPR